ncbi:MAG: protein kinase [Candidatus Eremiobacteraeota bacterium]|nr:protein kinase [Candidatus Eremiobacteraeota bacterium]
MLVPGQIIEAGGKKLRIVQHLGGKRNVTYKVTLQDGDTPYILRVIKRPGEAELKNLRESGKAEALEAFFEESDDLRGRYGHYSDEAALEIYRAALQGQVALEAQVLKEYRHPAMAEILQSSHDREAYYLLLNYIEGESFETIVEASGGESPPIPEEKALEWMNDIASVLRFFHSQTEEKILYNNLTPLNIIVDTKGKARLVDLQNIRIYDAGRNCTEDWQDVLLIDTPSPFIPVEGYKNPQSEIYAFGAVFYYLLTGIFLQDAHERLSHDQARPLREVSPGYSEKLELILTLCLELSPTHRFNSFESIIMALEMADFGALKVESEGGRLRTLSLGRIGRHDEKNAEILIKKPIPKDPLSIAVLSFKYQWRLKPEAEEPRVVLSDSRLHEDHLSASIVITSCDLPVGRYEGVATLETNWGKAEIPLALSCSQRSAFAPFIAGGSIAVLFITGLLLLRKAPSDIYDKTYLKWSNAGWMALKIKSPDLVAPRVDIDNTTQWEEYQKPAGLTIRPGAARLQISGTPKESSPKRTGWISSFFFPPMTGTTASVTLEAKEGEKDFTAGMMLLSSDRMAVCIEHEMPDSYRIGLMEGKKWEYKTFDAAAKMPRSRPRLEIQLSNADEYARCLVNGKELGEFTNVQIRDLALLLYVIPRGSGSPVEVTFGDLRVKFGAAVQKTPPFTLRTLGKISLRSKYLPGSKLIVNTYPNEEVEVLEVEREWSKVRLVQASHLEGWAKSSELQSILPKELKLE